MMEPTTSNHLRRMAQALWRGCVLTTMRQRRMVRGNEVPRAHALVLPGRIVYVLDMQGQDHLWMNDGGKRFHDEILAVGGSRPAAESFRAFRGRDPKVDALLRHNGMGTA